MGQFVDIGQIGVREDGFININVVDNSLYIYFRSVFSHHLLIS